MSRPVLCFSTFSYAVSANRTRGRRRQRMNLTFKRILPILFKLDNVAVFGWGSGCIFLVSYSLKDGSDLPKGPHLETPVRSLTRFQPANANRIILHKERQIHFPKKICTDFLRGHLPKVIF
jgi:hypothetical protein